MNHTPATRHPSRSFRLLISGALIALTLASAELPARGPALEYAVRFGGSANEEIRDVAVDAAGNVYVTGWTQSIDFGGPGGEEPTLFGPGGGGDAFVVKLSPDGGTILYATLFGGTSSEVPVGIAVDDGGFAYVAGATASIDTGFPTTDDAFRSSPANVFVVKLDPEGNLEYSTHFGTTQFVRPNGLALHGSGDTARVYLTGLTNPGGIPTTAGAHQGQLAGAGDAFLSVLEPGRENPASQLIYSTYFGSTGPDTGLDVATGPGGRATIAGSTNGNDLPIRHGFDASLEPGGDLFLAVFDPARSGEDSLVYSTYMGGTGGENGTVRYGGLAVGPDGVALVTGLTGSVDFPVTPEGHRVSLDFADAFLLAIDPSARGLDSLRYGTYLGGSGVDVGYDVAAGPPGIAYVVGGTGSRDLPGGDGEVAIKLGEGPGGQSQDSFLAKIDWTRVGDDSLVDVAYFGGSGGETGVAVAANATGDGVWVVGETTSDGFFEPTPGLGARDGFVLHAHTTIELPLAHLGDPSEDVLEANFGTGPHVWQVISGAPPAGLELSVDGILAGVPVEVETAVFTVEVTDSGGLTRTKTYRKRIVPDVEPDDVLIRKGGVTPVPGRSLPYTILLRNQTDRTLHDVEVVELLEYWFEFLGSSPPPTRLDPRPTGHVFWTIPQMRPDELVAITYRVRLPDDFPIGEEVSGEACLTEEDCAREKEECERNGKERCDNTACQGPGSGVRCIQCNKHEMELCRSEWHRCIGFVGIGNSETPPEGGFGGQCTTLKKRVFRPVDPNEKTVASGPFVPPGEELGYTIFFENIGDIEALDVFLTDVLDDDLDLSTLKVKRPYGGLVPLEPDGTVILHQEGDEIWSVTLDAATRTLSWDLIGIELPPGETDSVFFVVQAPEELPSGTEIRNEATIQFEVFEIITTNETLNTIDSTPPVGTMAPLPDITPAETFEISWGGTDEVGEIAGYVIYVSQDGGPFVQLWRAFESGSLTFEGEEGSTYAFHCLAGDTAGNLEIFDGLAETVTTIQLPDRPSFHRGDPAIDGQVDLSDPILILGYVFLGSPETLRCREAADVNNDAVIDITDAISLLGYIFLGNFQIWPPGPPLLPCGPDPDPPGSAGDLGCESYPGCP